MTKRALRDVIAAIATVLVLVLFGLYMNAASERSVRQAQWNRRPPPLPALELGIEASYTAGKEVWVDVGLSNPSDEELCVLEPAWPATLDFEIESAQEKEPPAADVPAIVSIPSGGRFVRRIDMNRAFELPPGEYVLRARYKSEGERVWTGSLLSQPARLKIAQPDGLPDVFTEMEE